jgi:hypothetical protein
MTASPFVGPTVQMERPARYRHPRPGRRPSRHLVAAIVTTVGVCGGLGLALSIAPRPETPGTVARAFVQALAEQDWPAVWRLHCRAGPLPDESAFVDRMSSIDQGFEAPAGTVVFVDEVTEVAGPGAPSFVVTLTIAARGHRADGSMRTQTARLPVVGEEGVFRVCLEPGWSPGLIR